MLKFDQLKTTKVAAPKKVATSNSTKRVIEVSDTSNKIAYPTLAQGCDCTPSGSAVVHYKISYLELKCSKCGNIHKVLPYNHKQTETPILNIKIINYSNMPLYMF